MWTLTFKNPPDIPHTTNLSGTVAFWLFGCLTIVLASQIDSHLQRRLGTNHARRNRTRHRAHGIRLVRPQVSERRGQLSGPQSWTTRTTPRTLPSMSPGPSQCSEPLYTSSSLQSPFSASVDRMPGEGMNAATERERFLQGDNAGCTDQGTPCRQDATASPREGFTRRVPSFERRRPVGTRRKARYRRPYVLDWLEGDRAYCYV